MLPQVKALCKLGSGNVAVTLVSEHILGVKQAACRVVLRVYPGVRSRVQITDPQSTDHNILGK